MGECTPILGLRRPRRPFLCPPGQSQSGVEAAALHTPRPAHPLAAPRYRLRTLRAGLFFLIARQVIGSEPDRVSPGHRDSARRTNPPRSTQRHVQISKQTHSSSSCSRTSRARLSSPVSSLHEFPNEPKLTQTGQSGETGCPGVRRIYVPIERATKQAYDDGRSPAPSHWPAPCGRGQGRRRSGAGEPGSARPPSLPGRRRPGLSRAAQPPGR
jgi:hypothetical protein